MKFTLSWLKDHLETDATLKEILEALNKLGLEVSFLKNTISDLRNFYENDIRWLRHFGFYPYDKPSFIWSKIKESNN